MQDATTIISLSPAVHTCISEMSDGSLLRAYACNPGGYFIERLNWLSGEGGGVRRATAIIVAAGVIGSCMNSRN